MINPHKQVFPQANNVDFMLKIISNYFESGMTKFDISNNYQIALREGSYYLDALLFLGLVEKIKIKYFLTKEGVILQNLKTGNERVKYMKTIILANNFIGKIHCDKNKLNYLANEYIVEIIMNNTNLNITTSKRRASTIVSWLKWVDNN